MLVRHWRPAGKRLFILEYAHIGDEGPENEVVNNTGPNLASSYPCVLFETQLVAICSSVPRIGTLHQTPLDNPLRAWWHLSVARHSSLQR